MKYIQSFELEGQGITNFHIGILTYCSSDTDLTTFIQISDFTILIQISSINVVYNYIAIDDTYYKSLLLQMETADAKFTPTKFWKVALEKMSDELLNGGVEKFRCNKNVNSFFEPLFQLEGLSYYGEETVDSVAKIINGCGGHSTKAPALIKQLNGGYHLALSQYCAFKAGDIQ